MARGQFPTPEQSLGSPLSVIRGAVEETAPGTLTEQAIALPTNPANNIGFLIRRVHFDMEATDFAFPAADAVVAIGSAGALSSRQGLLFFPVLANDGVVAAVEVVSLVGSAPADAGVAISTYYTHGPEWDFSIGGVLTATRELSLYILSSALATNQKTLQVVITGHIVRIEDVDLIAALSMEAGI